MTKEINDHVNFIRDTTAWLKEEAIHSTTMLQLTESIRADTQALRIATEDHARQAIYDKRLAIAEWFSSANPAADQSNIVRGWQNGTGTGFLDSTNFQSFREDNKSSLLCVGRPGAGKSMTAAVVVQYLWQRFRDQGSPNSELPGIAFFFFNYRRGELQGVYDVLSTLVKQLLVDLHEVPASIRVLHDLLAKRGARPTDIDLYMALQSAASAHGTTYIVLDALDECDSENRNELVEKLFSLQQDGDVRIMATGRDIPEVTELFSEGCLKSVIRANDDDVRTYLEPRLKSLGRSVQKDEKLQAMIIDKIIEAADGMFLLVQLHLEALKGKTSKREIKDALTTLPKGRDAIEKAYKDNLTRIDDQSPQRRDLARVAIIWIRYCDPPLTVEQLREVLSIQFGDEELDRDGLPDPELIVDVCCGLLVSETRSDSEKVIRFVHYTAAEFFQQHLCTWIPDAHEKLQLTCLTYLQFNRPESSSGTSPAHSPQPDGDEQYAIAPELERYVVAHWAEHFKPLGSLTGKVQQALVDLLLDDTKCETLATAEAGSTTFTPRKGFTGIHLAAQKGLQGIIPELLRQKGISDTADSIGRTPLSYAAEADEEEVVKYLIELKAHPTNPWSPDESGTHPVDYAEKLAGHKTFDLLRLSDQALSTLGSTENPQLRDAVMTGNLDAVELILRKPNIDDLNKANARGNSALHQAILLADEHGTKIVETLLLFEGIHLNAKNSDGDTALHLVAARGGLPMPEVLKMLLKHADIDVNVQNQQLQTPLHLAVYTNEAEIVETILTHSSVQINLKNTAGRMPIHLSICNASHSIVDLLLSHKDADVNVKDGHGRTPLITAIWWDIPKKGVQLVGKMGIDVNITDSWNKTPLMRAAAKGRLELVQAILNDPGVDIARRDSDGHCANWHAKTFGFPAICELIEEAGRSKGLTMDTTSSGDSNVVSAEPSVR